MYTELKFETAASPMYMQPMAMPIRMIGRHGIAMPAFLAAASEPGAAVSGLEDRARPLISDAARPQAPAMLKATPSESPSLPAAAFQRPPRIPARSEEHTSE